MGLWWVFVFVFVFVCVCVCVGGVQGGWFGDGRGGVGGGGWRRNSLLALGKTNPGNVDTPQQCRPTGLGLYGHHKSTTKSWLVGIWGQHVRCK